MYFKEFIIPALLFLFEKPLMPLKDMYGTALLGNLMFGLRNKNIKYTVVHRGATHRFSIQTALSEHQFELVQFETQLLLTLPEQYVVHMTKNKRGCSVQGNQLMMSLNSYQPILAPGLQTVKAVLLEEDNKFVNDLKKLYKPKEEVWA